MWNLLKVMCCVVGGGMEGDGWINRVELFGWVGLSVFDMRR